MPSAHWRPPVRFGLGGVAIGNAWHPTTEAEAEATLAAAWDAGVRYYDTSPFYGFGLSERRYGHFLHTQPRDAYTLSTKVGRIFTAADKPPAHPLWKQPSPFRYRYDYTAAGVRRSIEDSLQRLGIERIDIVYIHDLSPDNADLGDRWKESFAEAVKGAMPELCKLRDEGVIKAWGLGVNRPEPALAAIEASDPDIFLLATQYSLLEHAYTVEHVIPALAKRGISFVVGAPLEAGYLGGRARYDYDGTIPSEAPAKRQRIEAIAAKHGTDLRTAALQFCVTPAEVAAVVPGARTPAQVRANVQSMNAEIPAAFWEELRRERLVAPGARLPID